MAKITERGVVPADDPMFNGQWMIFGVRSKPSTKSGQSEKESEEPQSQQQQSEPEE